MANANVHPSVETGKECSFEQLEHVREMQEKLARLHFSLDVYVEELSEDQKKTVADRNLDQLLTNVSIVKNSVIPCLAETATLSPSSLSSLELTLNHAFYPVNFSRIPDGCLMEDI